MKIYAIYLECKCVGNDDIIKGYFTAETQIENTVYACLAEHIVNGLWYNDPDILFQELQRVTKMPNVLRGKIVRVPSEFIQYAVKPLASAMIR